MFSDTISFYIVRDRETGSTIETFRDKEKAFDFMLRIQEGDRYFVTKRTTVEREI